MPYYIGDVIQDENKLIARTPEKFRETGIEVLTHTRVTGVDTAKGLVEIEGRPSLNYDYLVFATGASAFVPDIPGLDLPDVCSLRNLEDVHVLAVDQLMDGAGELAAISPQLHFKREVDASTGFRSRQMLVAPIRDPDSERVIGVIQLINSQSGAPFSNVAEEGLLGLTQTLGVAFVRHAEKPARLRKAAQEMPADFAVWIESPSTRTASVKVPPTSTPSSIGQRQRSRRAAPWRSPRRRRASRSSSISAARPTNGAPCRIA